MKGGGVPTPFTRAVHPYHQDFVIEMPGQDILDRDPTNRRNALVRADATSV